MISKILTMDDFGTEWKYVANLEEIKRRIPNIKITLFTIPSYYNNKLRLIDDSRYVDWIYNNRNWIEIATHGYRHFGQSPEYGEGDVYVEGKRTYNEQYNLMKLGLDELGKFMPNNIRGYKAPGNHMNYDTLKALEHLNFQYYMWMDTIYVYDVDSQRQFKRYIPIGRTEVSPHIQEKQEYNHWFNIDYNNTEFLFLSEYIKTTTKGRL